MKWKDPRFAGYSRIGVGARLPPLKIKPSDYEVHTAPPTKEGRRAGAPRRQYLVPVFNLIPVRTGRLYR